jgi:ubiquinone/menaquinone biosynthesis C-methylase UbiE
MFTKSQRFYDLICSAKNYQSEAARIRGLVEIHKRSAGKAMLDVACGTGGHIPYLRDIFTVEGLDLDPGMLDVARTRHSSIPFHHGDMVDFDLGRQFDVILCLYSSIGYVKTEPRLLKAVANMARHLRPGGILIVEPFFFQPPGNLRPMQSSSARPTSRSRELWFGMLMARSRRQMPITWSRRGLALSTLWSGMRWACLPTTSTGLRSPKLD